MVLHVRCYRFHSNIVSIGSVAAYGLARAGRQFYGYIFVDVSSMRVFSTHKIWKQQGCHKGTDINGLQSLSAMPVIAHLNINVFHRRNKLESGLAIRKVVWSSSIASPAPRVVSTISAAGVGKLQMLQALSRSPVLSPVFATELPSKAPKGSNFSRSRATGESKRT